MLDKVILVDTNDKHLGVMEKMEAHRSAKLHRAVSVFIFNTRNQLLIQRRALNKYHSLGLWTNTVCTHPYPGESPVNAAIRRLNEEMGLKINTLTKLFDFVYKEKLDNELTEYEFDHVFAGITDDMPIPESTEVCDFRYVDADTLLKQIYNSPDNYTVWFKKIIKKVLTEFQLHKHNL